MIYLNWFLPYPCLFFFVELLQYALNELVIALLICFC